MLPAPSATLLFTPSVDESELARLAGSLSARWGQPCLPCPVTEPDGAVQSAIRDGLARGVGLLIALPVVPDGSGFSSLELRDSVRRVSRCFPFVAIHLAEPIKLEDWAGVVAACVPESESASAVILVGPTGTPEQNADLAMLARLVEERGRFAAVDYAFTGGAVPDVATVVRRQERLGMRRVELVGDGLSFNPWTHPALAELLTQRRRAALEAGPLFRKPTGGPPTVFVPPDQAELQALDAKINAILPPQYQGQYDQVKPKSMGTASLKFGPDGKVAWDEIWTSFCDLALAGGPAHRGTLLEPVAAEAALAEPEKYREVVEEIGRGIRLVTGLSVEPGATPGWVGVRCHDEAMADWLMRAIVVENVMARREGAILYLPAGPDFRLRKEIKNVVTSVAKTCHYWTEHMPRKETRP